MAKINLTNEQVEQLELAENLIERGHEHWVRQEYPQAEPLYQQALDLRTEILGPEDARVAHALQNIANLYFVQEKFPEAEATYQRAIIILESCPDSADLEIVERLLWLAE